jgi:hypothetical protein
MGLRELRDMALEATTRFFLDRDGILPDEGGDEWEAEYRHQYGLLKGAASASAPATPVAHGSAGHSQPELTGPPAEKRWAADLRAARLVRIADKELREWLAVAWTSATVWIETRDLADRAFLRRIEAEHAASRRRAEATAAETAAAEKSRTAETGALRARLDAAGITAAGLVDLIDVSPRIEAPTTLRRKIAEVEAGERNLRIFETGREGVLGVLEKNKTGRRQYAIERDDGLVSDLMLFAEASQHRHE